MVKIFEGTLVVEEDRGVIYFHKNNTHTVLRICGLKKIIGKDFTFIDIAIKGDKVFYGICEDTA
jgi:hypothetical protein